MPIWTLKGFSGERPRISPNLLPPNGAQSAINARLDDGALTALRTPAHVSSFPSYPGNYNSIYLYGSTWLGWNGYVKAVPGPVDSTRLYIMGDGAPQMMVGSTTYALAVPFPSGALTANVSGSGTGDTFTRIYVYTYVTAYGEESEPCPASNEITWQSGQTVNLTGFVAPPAGRDITIQRIYRTQTGTNGTDLYFIADIAAGTTTYTDTIADDDFGEVLPSRNYNAPPDSLTGLVAMPNGMMAAFTGNQVYFCQPWLPHAWPEEYVLTTDSNIVALGAVGTTLVIMTEANPYMAVGTDPSSMQMVKIESNLPCINAYGVQDMGYSIAYPSHEGLVLASADGTVRLVTEHLFNRNAWQQFNPSTITAGQLSGRYIASYNSTNPDGSPLIGTMIIVPSEQSATMIQSDISAQAFFYDIAGGVLYYLLSTGEIKQFDPLTGIPLNYYWKSRPALFPGAINFGAIIIDAVDDLSGQEIANIDAARQAAINANQTALASPLHAEVGGAIIDTYTLAGDGLELLPNPASTVAVGIYADGNKVASITESGSMQRLPSGFRARKWEIDVSGTMRVEQIAMAGTVDELRTVSPG